MRSKAETYCSADTAVIAESMGVPCTTYSTHAYTRTQTNVPTRHTCTCTTYLVLHVYPHIQCTHMHTHHIHARTQSAGGYDDMQEVKTGYKTDQGVRGKLSLHFPRDFFQSCVQNCTYMYVRKSGQGGYGYRPRKGRSEVITCTCISRLNKLTTSHHMTETTCITCTCTCTCIKRDLHTITCSLSAYINAHSNFILLSHEGLHVHVHAYVNAKV